MQKEVIYINETNKQTNKQQQQQQQKNIKKNTKLSLLFSLSNFSNLEGKKDGRKKIKF